MIVSHEYKFIFFAAGKTGTFSIENVLSKYHDDKAIELEESEFGISGVLPILGTKHIPPQVIRKSSKEPGHLEGFQSYFKFAFVRNPWDWVKCNYFHCFPEEENVEKIEKLEKEHIMKVHDHLGDGRWSRGLKTKTRYQYAFLADNNGEGPLLVDFVGKFEDMQQDFDEICDIIEIPREKLPHLNKGMRSKRKKHYSEFYTEESKELVRKLYRKDIEFFGYEYEQK